MFFSIVTQFDLIRRCLFVQLLLTVRLLTPPLAYLPLNPIISPFNGKLITLKWDSSLSKGCLVKQKH